LRNLSISSDIATASRLDLGRRARTSLGRFVCRAVLVALTVACGDDAPSGTAEGAFPEGVLFGTATAGFQVEMGCPTLPAQACEDRNSDWYAFITSEDTLGSGTAHLSGEAPSTGPGHWELYEQDFDLARDALHNNAYRMSIEWSRIFPEATDEAEDMDALRALADPEALAHYHAMLAALLARGLTPLVTVNHYTLPRWIHDGVGCHLSPADCAPRGWLDRERTVREIARYAAFLADEFGEEVDLWVTLNEPFALLLPGYLLPSEERSNPPARQLAFEDAKTVLAGLVEGHARIYDAIHAHDDDARVGVVYNLTPARPKDPDNPVDVQAAANFFYIWNDVYLDAVVLGRFDHDLDGTAEPRADLANRMDFLGVNYYTRVTVEGIDRSLLPALSPLLTLNPLTLKLWEDYPRGLYEMVKHVDERYDLPVIVTENGTFGPDEARSGFLVRHLAWLARAIAEGVRVEGYFFWSLMDNIEWNHGYALRFGLYRIDPEDPMKARIPREVADVYGQIAADGAISESLRARHPIP